MPENAALEHRLTTIEEKQKSQGKRIDGMEGKLEEIVKLLSTRPTWLITSVITVLTTVTASLIVYVLISPHH